VRERDTAKKEDHADVIRVHGACLPCKWPLKPPCSARHTLVKGHMGAEVTPAVVP
jgi:hypothetical protein